MRRSRVRDLLVGLTALAVTLPALASDVPSGESDGDFLYWDEPSGSWFVAQPPVVTNLTDSGQPTTAVNYIIALQGVFPSRSNADPFIAEIAMFAGNFAPRGWAFCNGQLLPISLNTAVFALIGTTYGGDGRTTVGLPDLRGRIPLHAGRGLGLPPVRVGQSGGTQTHFHTIP